MIADVPVSLNSVRKLFPAGDLRSVGHFRHQRGQSSPVEVVRPLRGPLPRLLDGQPLVHLLGHVQRRVQADGRQLFDPAPGSEQHASGPPDLHPVPGPVLDDDAAEENLAGKVELCLPVSEVRVPDEG